MDQINLVRTINYFYAYDGPARWSGPISGPVLSLDKTLFFKGFLNEAFALSRFKTLKTRDLTPINLGKRNSYY